MQQKPLALKVLRSAYPDCLHHVSSALSAVYEPQAVHKLPRYVAGTLQYRQQLVLCIESVQGQAPHKFGCQRTKVSRFL